MVLCVAMITACGGGEGTSGSSDGARSVIPASSFTATTPTQVSADPAAFARSAALSSADLTGAEQQAQAAEAASSPFALDALEAGQVAAKSAYSSGAVARKAAAVRIPVYRFYNGSTGAHFFTTSTTERDNVVNTLSPPFNLEGEAFSVASDFSPGLSPVHRFYNTQSGVHFYTISETERANVVANFPQFQHEGVAYHASQVAGAGLLPFYRFYVPGKGFHFYTANEAEKDSIIANLAATYTYEGIGYYVLDSDWRGKKLPHTGVPSYRCYQPGSDVLVTCSSGNVMNLNPQQDGHRAGINAMSYAVVGSYPVTSCVRDNITGLIWEGKEASGSRAGSNTYTNNGTNLPSDASAYVIAVNNLKLCGFSDWRLPTRQELMGIVDYGRFTEPRINGIWFPNTIGTIDGRYWSVDRLSTSNASAWWVSFDAGYSYSLFGVNGQPVRLVRGSSPNGPRFSYSTVAYASDASNNVVNDAWTGLQWRRCEQGRTWSGSVCTGGNSPFTHEQALAHTRTQSGWRMPNVKELGSLTDLSVSSAARIDATAFPNADPTTVWTSTPYVQVQSNYLGALFVDFSNGGSSGNPRSHYYAVRLVRDSQ